MIATLTMELEVPEGVFFSFQKSSLLQGVLMEHISPEYALKLHENGLKPYSQSVIVKKGKTFWHINTLSKEAYENMILPLLASDFEAFDLSHSDVTIKIKDKTLKTGSYDKLIDQYYFGEGDRHIRVAFGTPTAYKREGKYVFYPDISLILGSLMRRFDAFSEKAGMCSEETLEQLVEYSEIVRYDLHSILFSMEGVRIPAYMGNITIKIGGPQPLVNLIHLLLRYGEYAGVGIKTAMGMGKIEILEKGERNAR